MIFLEAKIKVYVCPGVGRVKRLDRVEMIQEVLFEKL